MSIKQNEDGTWNIYDDYWWSLKHRNIASKEEAELLEKEHTTKLTDDERFIMEVLKEESIDNG